MSLLLSPSVNSLLGITLVSMARGFGAAVYLFFVKPIL